MSAPHKFPDTVPATREHELRILLDAVAKGEFNHVPLNLFDEGQWSYHADWLRDVRGEPEDEAQVLAEVERMLRESGWHDDWCAMSESHQAEYADDFASYVTERREARTFRTMEAGNLMVSQFCDSFWGGARV